jgi:hypothetical protein
MEEPPRPKKKKKNKNFRFSAVQRKLNYVTVRAKQQVELIARVKEEKAKEKEAKEADPASTAQITQQPLPDIELPPDEPDLKWCVLFFFCFSLFLRDNDGAF